MIQQLNIKELHVARFSKKVLQDYKDNKFEAARVVKGGIPVVPAGILGYWACLNCKCYETCIVEDENG